MASALFLSTKVPVTDAVFTVTASEPTLFVLIVPITSEAVLVSSYILLLAVMPLTVRSRGVMLAAVVGWVSE